MTQYQGQHVDILWSQYDLTAYFQEATISQDLSVAESTTFGDAAREYLLGLKDGTIGLQGLFDDTATSGQDVVLATAFGNSTNPILTIGFGGATIAYRAKLAKVHEVTYEITGNFDDVVQVSADLQVTEGVDNGIFLKTHAAETSSTNGASQDNAASSAGGWAAHLHVTAMSTPTTLDVKIQHSTDNSVWADLTSGAFTQVTTSTTSQRLTGTATVNRYVRYVSTIVGTSYTYAVAFARR